MRAMEQEKMEMREEIQQLASRIEETAPRNIFFEGTARPVSPPKPKRPPTASSARSAAGGMSRASSCYSIASPRNHDKLEVMREAVMQEIDSVKSFVVMQCSKCSDQIQEHDAQRHKIEIGINERLRQISSSIQHLLTTSASIPAQQHANQSATASSRPASREGAASRPSSRDGLHRSSPSPEHCGSVTSVNMRVAGRSKSGTVSGNLAGFRAIGLTMMPSTSPTQWEEGQGEGASEETARIWRVLGQQRELFGRHRDALETHRDALEDLGSHRNKIANSCYAKHQIW